ncbi:MAG TPA: abortive infection family protein [Polyangiaceae bacterium]|nr:abortive infection family protein [Polyangiaceae bacterium]
MAKPDGGLSEAEMMSLVYDYIGVDGGYLYGFSYRSHEEFYPRYCNTRLDVAKRRREHGTTRETFLAILRDADPQLQARIIEGAFAFLPLEKFPEETRPAKAAAKTSLGNAVARLRGQAVQIDDLSIQSAAVDEAIRDAATLIRDRGNTSGIDRVHTALHGYLKALCRHHGVVVDENADAARLLKALRQSVANLQPSGPRSTDVARIHGALATIVDALNPIRNQASLAHPNESLLPIAEAALVIDAARSVMNYLNRKLG